ncbi:MAG: hypothetical protein HWN66_00950 [Candidatus Helarchaeota archaeon]|nr:hypothetical protein [Candidatus Helarchaeota archaeon]
MAIEGHVQKKAFHPGCLDENVERIPDDHFIEFDITSLKAERQFWVKRQVSHLVDQMLYHPERKPEYVQRINRLILYEKKLKGEKKRDD